MALIKLEKLKKGIREKYLFYFIFLILLFTLLFIQINVWFGEHSFSKLNVLNQEIEEKKYKNLSLKEKNRDLELEKKRLSAGSSSIEGIARLELGLIKSGETFYAFQSKDQEIEMKEPNDVKDNE